MTGRLDVDHAEADISSPPPFTRCSGGPDVPGRHPQSVRRETLLWPDDIGLDEFLALERINR
jgi:hypothetical protein